jgi:3-phytase
MMRRATILIVLAGCAAEDAGDDVPTARVEARGETRGATGDPDDPAIWFNAATPDDSRILGTDKEHGLFVYDLAGDVVQDLADGPSNSVDLRRVTLGGAARTIVTAGNRGDDTVRFYELDEATGTLTRMAPEGGLPAGLTIYGHCMAVDGDGRLHLFVDDKDGWVIERVVRDDGGALAWDEVRRFDVGGQVENCVVDDPTGDLYVGEEDVGVWRFDAWTAGDGTLVAAADGPHLHVDVEGLGLHGSLLVVSSQGDSAYAVYDRADGHRFAGRFRVASGAFDAASETDGLEVTTAELPGFPGGLLVVHDTANEGFTGNFKLVAWEDVAQAF